VARTPARRLDVELGSDEHGDIRSVAAGEWISASDAVRMIGTPSHRVEDLIANGHLEAAASPSADLGTTGSSVEREIASPHVELVAWGGTGGRRAMTWV
jgi:hypothetical protein